MGDDYVLIVKSLDVVGSVKDIDKGILEDAYRAINEGATRGRTMAEREVYRQLAVPQGYASPSSGRLYVGTRATIGSLRAVIQARSRPTSLARFVAGAAVPTKGQGRQQGVYVTVKPGVARYLPRAFLIPLRSGSDDTLNNLGLAVRSTGKPDNAYAPKQIGKDLWLLYGPSVAQVFQGEEGRGIRDQISEQIQNVVSQEFIRLQALRDG